MPTQILVFGDSIAHGMMDPDGGWARRLGKYVDERMLREPDFYCRLYNLSISGDTSEDVLRRFEFEARQRLREGRETLVIFAVGGNDAAFLSGKNGMLIPMERFHKNVNKLVSLARKLHAKILFVGLAPVDESKTTPIPWDTEKHYRNEDLKRYDATIKAVCAEGKIPYVEVFSIGKDSLFEDGMHPNPKGHEIIFRRVKAALLRNGWLK